MDSGENNWVLVFSWTTESRLGQEVGESVQKFKPERTALSIGFVPRGDSPDMRSQKEKLPTTNTDT